MADEATAVSQKNGNGKITNFQEFLETDGVDFLDIPVRGGKIVTIGSLTGVEWAQWTEMREDPQRRKLSGAFLVAKSLVDDKGNRIGDDSDASLQRLVHRNVKDTEAILRGVFKLNGIGPSAEIAAKNA
jgi:hypothetical protein